MWRIAITSVISELGEAKLASGLVGGNQTNSLDAWNSIEELCQKYQQTSDTARFIAHQTTALPIAIIVIIWILIFCNYCPHVSTCSIGNQLQSQMRTANLLRFFDTALSQTILKLMPQISAAEKARQRQGPAVRTEHDLRKVMRKSWKTRGLPKSTRSWDAERSKSWAAEPLARISRKRNDISNVLHLGHQWTSQKPPDSTVTIVTIVTSAPQNAWALGCPRRLPASQDVRSPRQSQHGGRSQNDLHGDRLMVILNDSEDEWPS